MGNSVTSVQERWHKRISDSNILRRLVDHVTGQLDPPLTSSQVTAALALVGKVLPSLKSVEVTGSVLHANLSKSELEARILALGQNPEKMWAEIEQRHRNQALIEHDAPDDDTLTDNQSNGVVMQAIESIDDDIE